MTIAPLNKCVRCGTLRHIYALAEEKPGAGKTCTDKIGCTNRFEQKEAQASRRQTQNA